MGIGLPDKGIGVAMAFQNRIRCQNRQVKVQTEARSTNSVQAEALWPCWSRYDTP
jgi:hypothetical protein